MNPLAELLKQQQLAAHTQNKQAADAIGQAQTKISEADAAFAAIVDTATGNVNNALDKAQKAQDNITVIESNPLNVFRGLFDPNFNLDTQQRQLQQSQFEINAAATRQKVAQTLRDTTRQTALDNVNLQLKKVGLVTSQLANTQSGLTALETSNRIQITSQIAGAAALGDKQLKQLIEQVKQDPSVSDIPLGVLQKVDAERSAANARLQILQAQLAGERAKKGGLKITFLQKLKKAMLESLGVPQLRAAMKQSQDPKNGGTVQFKDAAGNAFKFTTADLAEQLKKSMDIINAQVDESAAIQANTRRNALQVRASEITALRLAGGDEAKLPSDKVLKDANGRPLPFSDINPDSLPLALQGSVRELQLTVANASENPSVANNAAIKNAVKIVNDAIEKEKKRQISAAPDDAKPAFAEYLNSGDGKIQSDAAAKQLLLSEIGSGGSAVGTPGTLWQDVVTDFQTAAQDFASTENIISLNPIKGGSSRVPGFVIPSSQHRVTGVEKFDRIRAALPQNYQQLKMLKLMRIHFNALVDQSHSLLGGLKNAGVIKNSEGKSVFDLPTLAKLVAQRDIDLHSSGVLKEGESLTKQLFDQFDLSKEGVLKNNFPINNVTESALMRNLFGNNIASFYNNELAKFRFMVNQQRALLDKAAADIARKQQTQVPLFGTPIIPQGGGL